MHEHTAYTAHAADSPQPEPQAHPAPGAAGGADGSVTIDLYRATLGAVNAEHYLTAFARLDATGRVLPGWNWAAALCTLCWLAFWRLWTALLIYGLVLVTGGGLLAAATLGGPAVPAPMLVGLALAGLLLLCVVPGMYGDALLHMAVGQRVARAVQGAANLREAADALQAQAGSRNRLLAVALVGGLLLTLGAGVGWLLWRSSAGAPAVAAAPAPTLATAVPAASAPGATPAAVANKAEQEAPAPLDAQAAAPASAVTEAAVPPQPQPQFQPPPAAAPPPVTPTAASAAPEAKPPPAPSSKKAHNGKPAAQAKHTPPSQAGHERRLFVNVGTFADADNATRAQASLRQAGLPVRVERVQAASGRTLQRVRVGPFTSTAQANEAARKARALGLEAVPDVQGAGG